MSSLAERHGFKPTETDIKRLLDPDFFGMTDGLQKFNRITVITELLVKAGAIPDLELEDPLNEAFLRKIRAYFKEGLRTGCELEERGIRDENEGGLYVGIIRDEHSVQTIRFASINLNNSGPRSNAFCRVDINPYPHPYCTRSVQLPDGTDSIRHDYSSPVVSSDIARGVLEQFAQAHFTTHAHSY